MPCGIDYIQINNDLEFVSSLARKGCCWIVFFVWIWSLFVIWDLEFVICHEKRKCGMPL